MSFNRAATSAACAAALIFAFGAPSAAEGDQEWRVNTDDEAITVRTEIREKDEENVNPQP